MYLTEVEAFLRNGKESLLIGTPEQATLVHVVSLLCVVHCCMCKKKKEAIPTISFYILRGSLVLLCDGDVVKMHNWASPPSLTAKATNYTIPITLIKPC